MDIITNQRRSFGVDLHEYIKELDTVAEVIDILNQAYDNSLEISNAFVKNSAGCTNELTVEQMNIISNPYKILIELKKAYEVSNWLNGTTYSFEHIKMPETLQSKYSENKTNKLTRLFNKLTILKNKRLKKLKVDYPGFDSELDNHEKIDVVEWDEFVKDEPDRIPLLIVNRANLWPKTIPFDIFFEKDRTVALLEVPLYTCWIYGCEVYKIPTSFNYNLGYNKSDYEKYKL